MRLSKRSLLEGLPTDTVIEKVTKVIRQSFNQQQVAERTPRIHSPRECRQFRIGSFVDFV